MGRFMNFVRSIGYEKAWYSLNQLVEANHDYRFGPITVKSIEAVCLSPKINSVLEPQSAWHF
jgi:hypothetical protein